MTKKIILLILLLCLSVLLARWYFYTDLYELNIKAAKYTELNINKNKGWKVSLLKLIDVSRAVLPEYQPVHMERLDTSIGYKNKFLDKQKEDWRFIFDFSNQNEVNQNSIIVETKQALQQAISDVKPGTVIYMAPGRYLINKTVKLDQAGFENAPIELKSLNEEEPAELVVVTQEGFVLTAPYWIFSNLRFRGDCEFDTHCEHALHLAGNAKYAVIRNSEFKNFNAHIKANGNYSGQFPDFVLVENNNFTNEWVRETKNPVTPIDVVGGSNWIVKQNFIADFARKNKSKMSVSYGAFFKGAGENSLFEENLVACSWKLDYQSALDVRIGLSIGGGGSGKRFCRDKNCNFEYKDGKIHNNTILNCSDVGIYLNKAKQSQVYNNLLLSTLGIDARFPSTSADISNNSLNGRIKSRDNASTVLVDNHILSYEFHSLNAN